MIEHMLIIIHDSYVPFHIQLHRIHMYVLYIYMQLRKKLRDHFKMISFSGFTIYWYVLE